MAVKTEALYNVDTQPIKGKFYRYIRTRYADEPLSIKGAFENGGRYNVAGLFGALYLGFDRHTCEAEVTTDITAGVSFKTGAVTVWDYDALLQKIVRLDDATMQASIGVTRGELTVPGDHWTASAIGEHLHKRGDVDFCGFL